jgi:hypothetical protein
MVNKWTGGSGSSTTARWRAQQLAHLQTSAKTGSVVEDAFALAAGCSRVDTPPPSANLSGPLFS